MKTPHKHAEMIKEWIQDTSKVVEWFDVELFHWEVTENPSWDKELLYRFKPTPKPDFKILAKVSNWTVLFNYVGRPNIEFTFDGETHQLKDAKVLK